MITRRGLLFGSVSFALRQGQFERAVRLIDARVGSGDVSAAVLAVQSGGNVSSHAFGEARIPDAVFLLASITKPMTSTAAMILSDRGELSLNDPVQKFIPEFRGEGREQVKIRHLLTHTSGLPDMLPENTELRKRHAPLKDFVAGTCRTPLLFTPGKETRYQSMGILLAAEIVQRLTHQPLPAFLAARVYKPLGMQKTSLGLGGRRIADTMQCQVEEVNDYDWNSDYWRNLGAPWGGAHSTAGDILKFLQYFAHPDNKVLKPETAAMMVTNQNQGLAPWGIGWSVGKGKFGKGCSAQTFGHGGSTGTLCWMDPANDIAFVLLTTKPAAQSQKTLISPVSDVISGAPATA